MKKKLKFKSKNLNYSNFKIGRTIGEGTFGKVKLGKHLITKELVIIF